MDLRELALRVKSEVISTRRAFHMQAEERWKETWTLGEIRQTVEDVRRDIGVRGLSLITTIAENRGGLVVDLTVNSTWPRVLFRADVDALPVKEATGLVCAATNGKMHACGHDANTAMLLTALEVMADTADFPFANNIRFVWQRAEENPVTPSGGDVLVNEEGVCDGISAAFALHLMTDGLTGAFSSRPGALLGNSGRLGIKIRTSGGHVAEPHKGVNALRVVQKVMDAIDTHASFLRFPHIPREDNIDEDPTRSLVSVEPAIVNSGTASNIMPSEAEMWVAVRTMLPREEHIKFLETMETEVRHKVSLFLGASVEFERVLGHPATINTPYQVKRVAGLLQGAGEEYWTREPMLGGEDFAHYLMKVPGAMFMLGANQDGCGPLHSPTFNPDESVLWRGVHFWLLLAANNV